MKHLISAVICWFSTYAIAIALYFAFPLMGPMCSWLPSDDHCRSVMLENNAMLSSDLAGYTFFLAFIPVLLLSKFGPRAMHALFLVPTCAVAALIVLLAEVSGTINALDVSITDSWGYTAGAFLWIGLLVAPYVFGALSITILNWIFTQSSTHESH
jgi:hypothetical protein